MPIRIISQAPVEKKTSTAEDIGRSIPTGLAEGVSAMVGTFGDLRSAGEGAVQWAGDRMGFKGPAPKMSAPLPVELVTRAGAKLLSDNTGVDPRFTKLAMALGTPGGLMTAPTSKEVLGAATRDKPLYQPQTKAGKYARTISQFGPAVATPGSAARRIANVLVPGAVSEAAGQLTEGSKIEPYARLAGALAGAGGVAMVGRGSPDTRLLAEASRGASDQQVAAARALMEEGAQRGVRLTMAEALQQVTNSGTGMGRMQRVIEGTRAGNERIAPVMAERPAQVRQAIIGQADQIAPSTADPYVMGQQAQEASGQVLTGVRQQINANARPFYQALKDERLVAPAPSGSRFYSNPIQEGHDYHSFDYTSPGGERVAGFIKPPPGGGGPMEIDITGPSGLSAYEEGAGRLGVSGVRDLASQAAAAYPEATTVQGLRVTGARPKPANASVDASRLRALGGGTPEAAAAYRQLTSNPAYHEALVSVRSSPILNAEIAQLPDDSLAVIDEVTKQLGMLAENARPNPAASTGNAQMSAAYDAARSQADQLAAAASEPWRLSRAMVASGREAFLEPLQAGPIGAMSKTSDLGAQTRALYPSAPMEGAAPATSQALTMLEQQQPGLGAGLTRQQLVNSANEATQDLQSGPNPWGGAKWAATQMGNPEQARTLQAGVGAVGGDVGSLDRLAEVLRATGKRQPPGSLTAYNAKDLEELGKAGVVGEGLRTGLNPPGIFRRLGQGFQDWQTERNSGRLAEAIIANPAEAERILMRAREVVPAGPELQSIERLALAASLSRQPQLEGR